MTTISPFDWSTSLVEPTPWFAQLKQQQQQQLPHNDVSFWSHFQKAPHDRNLQQAEDDNQLELLLKDSCTSSLLKWIIPSFLTAESSANYTSRELLYGYGVYSMNILPSIYAAFFHDTDNNNNVLTNATDLPRSWNQHGKLLDRFWDQTLVLNGTTRILAVTGDDFYESAEKVQELLPYIFIPRATAPDNWTELITGGIMTIVDALGSSNHPILSVSANFIDPSRSRPEEDTRPLPPIQNVSTITLGRGMHQFWIETSINNDPDVALDFLLAHEYAHALQSHVLNKTLGRVDVRRFELMADAFAGVYLSAQATASARDVSAVAHEMGDFSLDSTESHHGTPSQRECASLVLTDLEKKKFTTDRAIVDWARIFDELLPQILDLSAPPCQGLTLREECIDDEYDPGVTEGDRLRFTLSPTVSPAPVSVTQLSPGRLPDNTVAPALSPVVMMVSSSSPSTIIPDEPDAPDEESSDNEDWQDAPLQPGGSISLPENNTVVVSTLPQNASGSSRSVEGWMLRLVMLFSWVACSQS